MGLFDKIFSGSDEPKPEENLIWIDLENKDQLDEVITNSSNQVQLIFKHSTRCGISRMVIGQFKKDYKSIENSTDLYYLDLLKHRDISSEIANRFEIIHESPQLLILKDGLVIKHANHGDINELNLSEYL